MEVTEGAAAAVAAACPVLTTPAAGTTVRAVPPNCRRLAATAVHANGPITEPPPSPPVNKPNKPPATPETEPATAPTEATGATAPAPDTARDRASAIGVATAVCVGCAVTDAAGTASLAGVGVSANQVRTESVRAARAARAGGIRLGFVATATGLPCAGELLAEFRADAADATADAGRAARREDDVDAPAVPVWDLGDEVVDDASVPPLSADATPAPGAPVSDTPRANAAAPILTTFRPAINRPLLITEYFSAEINRSEGVVQPV